MIKIYLIYILCLVGIHSLAGYDSRSQKCKYIIINNNILRMLLIDEFTFFEGSRKRLKNDVNKMTISGLILYIFSFLMLVLSIVLLCLMPRLPVEHWIFKTVDTLNEKLAAICILIVFLFLVWYTAVRAVQYAKRTERTKWIRAFMYIFSFSMILLVISIAIVIINEFIMCLI